jgi:hypothetical protein
MAITVGVPTNAWQCMQGTGPRPSHTIAAHEWALESWFVSVNFNDQTNAYVLADGAQFNPTAIIAQVARDGHARTAVGAVCVEAGEDNGTLTVGGPCTISAPGVVHCHIYVEDGTTERAGAPTAWGAPATWMKDVVFVVSCIKFLV